MVNNLFRQLKKNDRGASLIEFALVTPLLLALVMGIIEFGWVYNGYITLNGATREGARVATIYKMLPGEEGYTGYIEDEVQKHETNTLQINAVNVHSHEEGQGENATKSVRVEAEGSISLLLGGIPFIPLPDPFEIAAQTTMRLE